MSIVSPFDNSDLWYSLCVIKRPGLLAPVHVMFAGMEKLGLFYSAEGMTGEMLSIMKEVIDE